MPPKRKRPDRPSADGTRPSPHRPGDMSLGMHDRDDGSGRGRGARRSRGGHRDSMPSQGRGGGSFHQQQPSSPTTRRASATPQAAPLALPPQQPATKQPEEITPKSVATPRLPYTYELLTDEKINSWTGAAREDILKHGQQSRDDKDITELSNLFQEFIHAVLDSRLESEDAGSCIRAILGDEADAERDDEAMPFSLHNLFLDSLAMVMDSEPEEYQASLRTFLLATGVSSELMRHVLDAPILQQLSLIRDNFSRLGVRQATNLLYRQANYNLLREETEGYSKLLTELFTISGKTPSPEMAEQTFEKIKALIGTFDLDVGRALDVTLDVAAAVLIKQDRFLVKLMRVSSWWPRSNDRPSSILQVGGLPLWATPGYPQWATTEEDEALVRQQRLLRDVAFWDRAREIHLGAFFELGGRQVTAADLQQWSTTNDENANSQAADAQSQWVKETNTLPPSGNRVAAQLLGFKLRFYNSDSREETDILPANLLYLAALLIKVGFISLNDLYPHLWPADENMESLREKQMQKLQEAERKSRGGPMNALLTAGVLPQGDDDNPSSSGLPRREPPKKSEPEQAKATPVEQAEPKSKLPEPLEQKVTLLVQLLTIGAIPESLFILGRFPWIPEAFPDVLDRIHRLLHVCVDKVYGDSRPTSHKPAGCPSKEIPDFDQTGLPKGSVRLTKPKTKTPIRWPYPDRWDKNVTQNYRYYWSDWTDNVPVCQTVDDVFTLCDTFLNLSGVEIGKDEALLAKLSSIGAKSIAQDKSEANFSRWLALLRRLLVPALSQTHANSSVVNSIWALLRHYPITTRYSLYAEWFEGQISRLPAMKASFARATAETRGTMKRVSLTNLGEMAKQLAKTSTSSPGIVFRVAFEQLESYPNLIEAFVECAKYFTDLSYDVLVWSLLSSLAKSRSRTQADHALTTSKWLTALSRFSGKVFRRYSLINPTPVLQYVNDQLYAGNSTDLIILKEFTYSMGGIVDALDFTDQQIMAMAGGEYLRRHTLIQAQDKRFDNVKSSRRLIKALTDSKLAARLLINLAQFRQAAIYKVPEDEAHIKYLSSLVDDSHQILIQYLDFLWSNLDPATFEDLVPSITELVSSYGLDASLAFLINRAILAHRMFPWKAKKSASAKEKVQPSQQAADKDGDVSMSEAKPADASENPAVTASPTEDPTAAATTATPGSPTIQQPAPKSDDASLIRSTLQPIVDCVQDQVSPDVWQKITPELFVTFWALQLGDLYCPDKIYRKERDRLKSEELALSRDRSDMTRRGQEKKMEKRKELMQLQIDLSEECSEHLIRQGKWKFYLTRQFPSFFPDTMAKAENVADTLLEQCFLPRILLSTADAEFTYKFVKALHDWNAPKFKLMALYDRLFNANRLRSLIFTCTVREAEYLGRFLRLVLDDLSRWHKNDPTSSEKDSKGNRLGAYDKEGKGTTDQPRLGFALTVDSTGKPETFVEHAQFQDLLFRWHKNLNTALKACLGGTEWMHIRNAITVLRAILDFFPAVDFMATQFSNQLQKITKQEAAPKTNAASEEGHRVDLSVAAQGALSELQKRKSKWVMVQAFRPNTVGSSQNEAEKASNLRPTAPDFKPQSSKPGEGQTTAEEDGEVKDELNAKKSRATDPPAAPATPKDTLPAKPSPASREKGREATPVSGPSRTSTPKNLSDANGSRGDNRPHSLPDRPPHNLPSRPDVPIPSHFSQTGRGADRRETRDPRDPRGPRDSREQRDPRDSRESRDARDSRDTRDPRANWLREKDQDRRAPENSRDLSRNDPPPRHVANDRRSHRDSRSAPQERGNESGAQPSSQLAGPQAPTADAPQPSSKAERAVLPGQDGPARPSRGPDSERSGRGRPSGPPASMENVNPARAAQIDDGIEKTPSRPPRDDGRSRQRHLSPRRSGRSQPDHHPSQDPQGDRIGGRSYPEQRSAGHNARDRSPHPSSHHGQRPVERESERGPADRNRDASGFLNHRAGPEAERTGPSFQDQNYGRLNPVPAVGDAPSGPRGRGRGSARGSQGGYQPSPAAPPSGPGPEARYPNDSQRPPSPERHPPTGPSSGRGRRSAYESNGNPSTPSGPQTHPDRARNVGPGGGDISNTPASSANATPVSTVHPDRLAQTGGQQAQPGSNHSQGRYSSYPANTPDRSSSRPSSGNNGPGPGPIEPPSAPTGPASNDQRPRSGGGRRQLAGINNMLQQSQAPTPESTRGNARRSQPRQMLGGNSDAQVLTGGSPVTTPSHERQDPVRAEQFPRGPPMGNDGPGHDRGHKERESRSERSGRESRRSSRERDSDRSLRGDRDGKDHREYRDRRSGPAPDGDGRRMPREGLGDTMGPPGPPAQSGLGGPRDNRPRSEAMGGGMRGEEWGGQRGPRGGPRDGPGYRSDERREDRGRKRRSEEGTGPLPNDREKRPRR